MQGKASPDKLKVGGRFKHIRVVTMKDGKGKETKTRKGTILEIYPHIFVAQMDGKKYKECFSKNLLKTSHVEVIRLM